MSRSNWFAKISELHSHYACGSQGRLHGLLMPPELLPTAGKEGEG